MNSQQRGFALPSWEQGGFDGPDVERSVKEMSDVGAQWVQFNPTWYQRSIDSNEIKRWRRSLSDGGLKRAISIAHQHGLKVFLKPHIDLPDPAKNSRSTIKPSDPQAWFESYTAFISHYADMAQQLGVEQFAIGTELASISDRRADWLNVIGTVRQRYGGTITYASDADEYPRVSFWDALDLIGIDAYWPLSDTPTTDTGQLRQSWKSKRDELAAFSAENGRKILFTEAGYTSQEGTTTKPYSWNVSTVADQDEQAAGYEALLATFHDESWWAGVYWWVWNALPDSGDHATDFSPKGKTAESVVRSWWTN